jgi:hypothetical protein
MMNWQAKLSSFFQSFDRNEVAYWLGLLMLFAGLALSVSMATALTVCGGVMIFESSFTSYIAAWVNSKVKN